MLMVEKYVAATNNFKTAKQKIDRPSPALEFTISYTVTP
jgi:hypothetical protein